MCSSLAGEFALSVLPLSTYFFHFPDRYVLKGSYFTLVLNSSSVLVQLVTWNELPYLELRCVCAKGNSTWQSLYFEKHCHVLIGPR